MSSPSNQDSSSLILSKLFHAAKTGDRRAIRKGLSERPELLNAVDLVLLKINKLIYRYAMISIIQPRKVAL